MVIMALNIMRSTSLKAQKSPPSSPRRKKIVRFADSLGLDLAAVKMIMQEDLPSIPDSAFIHLNIPKDWYISPSKNVKANIINTTTNGYAKPNGTLNNGTSSPLSGSLNDLCRGLNGYMTSNGTKDELVPNSCGYGKMNASCAAQSLSSSPVVQSSFHDFMASLRISHNSSPRGGSPANGSPVNCGSPINGRSSPVTVSTLAGCLSGSNSSLNKIEDSMSSINKSMPPWLSLYQQTSKATLIPEFVEPFIQMNFLERVRSQNVCLENCYISTSGVSGSISVTCCVRLVNRGFEKQVYIRYTTNNWATHTDVPATYIPRSSDGWSDRFTATVTVKNLTAGQRVFVAVRYLANNTEEFWDNNSGNNYSFMHRL